MKKNLGEEKEDDIRPNEGKVEEWVLMLMFRKPNEGKVEEWVLMLMFRKLCLIMIFEICKKD